MANINDKITKVMDTVNPNVAKVTTDRLVGSNTLYANNLSGWQEDTATHFITYRLDSEGEPMEDTRSDWKGIADQSTNTIHNLTWIAGAIDSGSMIDDIIECTPTAPWANDLAEALLGFFNPNGTVRQSETVVRMFNDMCTPVATRREYYGTKATFDVDPARHGWLFMEKEVAYDKSTYQRLYDHLVSVDADSVKDHASTTFKFADKWFGTVGVSLDPTQTEFNTLGKTAGAKTHTLTVPQLPNHAHSLSGVWLQEAGYGNVNAGSTSGANRANVSGGSTGSQGSNQPHNNLQPSIAVSHIVKF